MVFPSVHISYINTFSPPVVYRLIGGEQIFLETPGHAGKGLKLKCKMQIKLAVAKGAQFNQKVCTKIRFSYRVKNDK